jgi:hypothetical protein
MNAPSPIDPTTYYSPAELDPEPPRSSSRRRRQVAAGLVCGIVVAALLLAALVIPAGSDDNSADAAGSDSPADTDDQDAKDVSSQTGAGRSGSTTSTSLDPTGSSADGPGFPGGSGGSTAAPPLLETIGDIVLEPGVYERDLVLRNTGGSPLTWNATPETGDQLSPASGVIPAGDQVIVHLTADPYSTGSKQWTHNAIIHSDGGDAQIALHGTTLLPAQPEIVGGTQVNVLGNVYVFANGAINVGLQIKNDGDLPLNISFEPAAGALAQGGPDHVIEGGQIEFVAFSLCGKPAPAVLTTYDIPVSISVDGNYIGSIFLRFNQNAAQPTGPC